MRNSELRGELIRDHTTVSAFTDKAAGFAPVKQSVSDFALPLSKFGIPNSELKAQNTNHMKGDSK